MPGAPRIAVVGGGVGACSLVYGLLDHLSRATVQLQLFEMGRGAGGRAATRGTRGRPELRVNHGAPAFKARTPRFEGLCDAIGAQAIERAAAPHLFGRLTRDGAFEAEANAPTRFVAADGLGMSAFCEALLRGGVAAPAPPLAQTTFGTMVASVAASRSEAGATQWTLTSKTGESLGTFDFLVITSTGLAHPRWRTTFGGEPPLVAAASTLGDANLDAALAQLAPLTSKPVTACMLAYEAEAAAAWAALPFYKATVDDDDTLARIVVQRLTPSLTAVVLHSTHTFAEGARHVYGATSTAARIAGAASDADAEREVLAAMLSAAETRLGSMLGGSHHVRSPAWGPHLHRWGAAFPGAPLLPEANAIVPSAAVAFCGDFIDGGDGTAGSVEGAALSGLKTAEKIAAALGLSGESCA